MGRITYSYDITEDRNDIEVHQQAWKMYFALLDMQGYLRSQVKYEDNEHAEPIQEKFLYILADRGVDLDAIE